MQELLQLGIDGIAVGSVLALAAVGLTLTYGILRLSNFAHGDLLTLGAYGTLLVDSVVKNLGLAIGLSALATVAFSLVLDRVLWSYFRRQRATPTTMMIASIGVALVIRNLIVLIWGASPQRYNLPTYAAVNLFGMLITFNRLVTIGLAAVIIGAVYYLLQNTKLGRAMRAVADNPELAKISGVNVEKIVGWTWVIAAAAAVLAGSMYGLITNLRPGMGWSLILPIFASVILGGIGNPYGAIAGAMIIGVTQEVSTYCPDPAGYCLGTDYKLAVGLAMMILVLLFRPQGLFKGTF
ncbi:MAG: branched-chain amino acid ABC transporter permease [Pseudanabaenaceae cyanobacterium bins.68]|nr:branched-chain amino acid ABC transporter permease [Pseudanabaenaceae cyanobacterium bins.68]